MQAAVPFRAPGEHQPQHPRSATHNDAILFTTEILAPAEYQAQCASGIKHAALRQREEGQELPSSSASPTGIGQ